MSISNLVFLASVLSFSCSCSQSKVQLTHGVDESAGGGQAYIVTTPETIYYLEKEGGGLSSMVDKDGIDWLGFHNKEGSAHKGEYRGFPNAIDKQDGSYFHAMNAKTDPSSSIVDFESKDHIRITFTSNNEKWQGQWDFYPNRCDFTMTQISKDFKYWVQYEGVPGGQMDSTDFWFCSGNEKKNSINTYQIGDLPSPEWIAFGDEESPRMIYLLHHEDDNHPDIYESRPDMTVFAFGRESKNKFLSKVNKFSIGFAETKLHSEVEGVVINVLE